MRACPSAFLAVFLASTLAVAEQKISFEPVPDYQAPEYRLRVLVTESKPQGKVTPPPTFEVRLTTGPHPPPNFLEKASKVVVFVGRDKPPLGTHAKGRGLTWSQRHDSGFEHDGRGPYDDEIESLKGSLIQAEIDALKARPGQPLTFVVLDAKGRTLFVRDVRDSDFESAPSSP